MKPGDVIPDLGRGDLPPRKPAWLRMKRQGGREYNGLKTLLQEWSVPPWWRDRVPLIFLQEELVAVADLSRCQSSRWRQGTQGDEPLWRLSWQRSNSASSD